MKALKTKVLIVDDEELLCAGIKRLFRLSPIATVIGSINNPSHAFKTVRRLHPDLVMIDFELDGVNLSQALKQRWPKLKTMVFMPPNLTANLFSLTPAAADAYCLKTLSVEELFTAIETVMEGSTWIDPAITRLLVETHLKVDRRKRGAYDLTQRELDILALIVEGCTNQQIAALLHIQIETVKTHLRNIISKMEVRDRTQAAIKALRKGVIS